MSQHKTLLIHSFLCLILHYSFYTIHLIAKVKQDDIAVLNNVIFWLAAV